METKRFLPFFIYNFFFIYLPLPPFPFQFKTSDILSICRMSNNLHMIFSSETLQRILYSLFSVFYTPDARSRSYKRNMSANPLLLSILICPRSKLIDVLKNRQNRDSLSLHSFFFLF